MNTTYGLYKETTCYNYHDDGGGSSRYTEILGTDDDRDKLRRRWNQARRQERDALKKKGAHISYITAVAPNFASGKYSLSYYGSNGGGYSSVEHNLKIKLIPQFDSKKR